MRGELGGYVCRGARHRHGGEACVDVDDRSGGFFGIWLASDPGYGCSVDAQDVNLLSDREWVSEGRKTRRTHVCAPPGCYLLLCEGLALQHESGIGEHDICRSAKSALHVFEKIHDIVLLGNIGGESGGSCATCVELRERKKGIFERILSTTSNDYSFCPSPNPHSCDGLDVLAESPRQEPLLVLTAPIPVPPPVMTTILPLAASRCWSVSGWSSSGTLRCTVGVN